MTQMVANSPTQDTRRPGRETTYTDEVGSIICDALARGLTPIASCQLAGVDDFTMQGWIDQDITYRRRVARAHAIAEQAFTQSIYDAAIAGDYKAGVEWLKRRRRADYGDTLDIRKVDVDVLAQFLSAAEGASVSIDCNSLLQLEAGDEEL